MKQKILEILKFKPARYLYESTIREKFPGFMELLFSKTSFLPNDCRLSERLFCAYHGIDTLPKCPHCDKERSTTFNSFDMSLERYLYGFCSQKCCREFYGVCFMNDRIDHRLPRMNEATIRNEIEESLKVKHSFPSLTALNSLKSILLETKNDLLESKKLSIKTVIERWNLGLGHPRCLVCNELCIPDLAGCLHNFCSCICAGNFETTLWRREETVQNLYGVTNVFQSSEIKKIIKEINLERLGVEYPTQNLEVQERVKVTNLKRYGFECASQNLKVKEKTKQTHFHNYGCWYSQTDEHQKANYQNYEYIFPSGRKVNVMGYESKAIDYLLSLNYKEDDLLIDDKEIHEAIGKFTYVMDGKEKRYFPDIYDISGKRIIEVKSIYTLKNDLRKNLFKRDSVLNRGFRFEFLVYTDSGERMLLSEEIEKIISIEDL